MATLTFRGFVYREGQPVGGVRVRAYPVLADGSLGANYAETSSAQGTGAWQLSVDTSQLASPTGLYDLELFDPQTGQRRWIKGNVSFQVANLFGPDGSLPFPDNSVTTAKIADAAVTDSKLGNRTVDQGTGVAYANTGSLTQILSWVAKRFKEILGTANWSDAVPITLTSLASHASRHKTGGADPLTAADIGAAPESHTHPVATQTSDGFMSAGDKTKLDTLKGYAAVKVGSTLVTAGSAQDTVELVAGTNVTLTPDATNKKVTIAASGGTAPPAYGTVQVGSTSIAAGQSSDTLKLAAGSNITLTPDTTNKQVTIAVSPQGSGSGLGADTLDGYHAGTGSNQIPISTGTVCTNLNADMVDGKHSSDFLVGPLVLGSQSSTPTSVGAISNTSDTTIASMNLSIAGTYLILGFASIVLGSGPTSTAVTLKINGDTVFNNTMYNGSSGSMTYPITVPYVIGPVAANTFVNLTAQASNTGASCYYARIVALRINLP